MDITFFRPNFKELDIMNSKTSYESPRQRAWNAIRKSADAFTVAQVAEDAGMVYESVRGFVGQLVKVGMVQVLDEMPIHHPNCVVKQKTFQLIKDVGYSYPVMTKSGQLITGVSGTKAMWNTLRIHKSPLNADELAAISSNDSLSIEATTANNYLMMLHKAGYLKVVKEARVTGGKTKYILLPEMNNGPKPPQIQRAKHVFDPNTNEVMYAERPELDEELKHGTLLGVLDA